MKSIEWERLQMLASGRMASLDYLRDYYGLEWPLTGEAEAVFERFASRRVGQSHQSSAAVSRVTIEGLMSADGVLTKKWMAARLGMDQASLEVVVSRSGRLGMQPSRYMTGEAFIAQSFAEDLRSHLPRMRFLTFSDHTRFCLRLHVEIAQALEHKPDVLFCKTSQLMHEYPQQIAEYFDCITLEPLSGKHAAWLDFGKPLYLPPDRCSKLLFVQSRKELEPYLAGKSKPSNLDAYERAAEDGGHGT